MSEAGRLDNSMGGDRNEDADELVDGEEQHEADGASAPNVGAGRRTAEEKKGTKMGRPSKLTLELREQICLAI